MVLLNCKLDNIPIEEQLHTSFSVIDLIQMKTKEEPAILVSRNSADFEHINLTYVEENHPENLAKLVNDGKTMVEHARNRSNPNKVDEDYLLIEELRELNNRVHLINIESKKILMYCKFGSSKKKKRARMSIILWIV
jgi:hypothetical protein